MKKQNLTMEQAALLAALHWYPVEVVTRVDLKTDLLEGLGLVTSNKHFHEYFYSQGEKYNEFLDCVSGIDAIYDKEISVALAMLGDSQQFVKDMGGFLEVADTYNPKYFNMDESLTQLAKTTCEIIREKMQEEIESLTEENVQQS